MLDNSPAPKLAYGIADFARAVGVSRDKVYSEIRDGRLQAHKIGSRSVITADAATTSIWRAFPRSKAPPETKNAAGFASPAAL